MSHFIFILILYVSFINLSWIKKCLFRENMVPLSRQEFCFLLPFSVVAGLDGSVGCTSNW